MQKKIFLVIFIILFTFILYSSGKKKLEKASTHIYDAEINIYKLQMTNNNLIKKKEIVVSDIIRLNDGSPQKFHYKEIKLSKQLRVVIKADMIELLKINIYTKEKLIFEINERQYEDVINNNFSFKFNDKKITYCIKVKTWLGYIGDFGHGSTMGSSYFKKK